MFLLDTNVPSELRRPAKADPHVLSWSNQVDEKDCYLSVTSVMEIEIGILQVERRDPVQGAALRHWLDSEVLPGFSSRILSITLPIARRMATVQVPDKRSYHDAYIAATALEHGLTVVTRNVKDFEPLGVRLLNPWEPQASTTKV